MTPPSAPERATGTTDHMPFKGHRTCAEWGKSVKIDLNTAPSSMEQLAASWRKPAPSPSAVHATTPHPAGVLDA